LAESRQRDADRGHSDDGEEFSGRKFHVMRTLARLHECDEETLLDCLDASEQQVKDILEDMSSKNEVEVRLGPGSRTRSHRSYALTLNGWGEYLTALGSMYELTE
jgi:hypothetical protein